MFSFFKRKKESPFSLEFQEIALNANHKFMEIMKAFVESFNDEIEFFLDGMHPQSLGAPLMAVVFHSELSTALSLRAYKGLSSENYQKCFSISGEFRKLVSITHELNYIGWSNLVFLDETLCDDSENSEIWGECLVTLIERTDLRLYRKVEENKDRFSNIKIFFDRKCNELFSMDSSVRRTRWISY